MTTQCVQGYSQRTIQGVSGCFRDQWKDPQPFGPDLLKKTCSDDDWHRDQNRANFCHHPTDPRYQDYANNCWTSGSQGGCIDKTSIGWSLPPQGHFVCMGKNVNGVPTTVGWTDFLQNDEIIQPQALSSSSWCTETSPVY